MRTNEAKILNGDWIEQLKLLPGQSVHTCVTSPPYFGLRDYGVNGQFGLEKTVKEYVEKAVEGFEEVRRVLRNDGTLWLNLGDSYAGSGKGGHSEEKRSLGWQPDFPNKGDKYGFKAKDLMLIPARVAIALQEAGWYLRSEIIWHKPNPMPESVTDRPTKSHEQIYLFSKSEKYFYDYVAIQEPANYDGRKATMFQGSEKYNSVAIPGADSQSFFAGNHERWQKNAKGEMVRNKRSVWTVSTANLPDAHFATFPEKLIEPCILAGASEKGCCADCLSPYVRDLEKTGERLTGKGGSKKAVELIKQYRGGESVDSSVFVEGRLNVYSTIGWRKTCQCETNRIIPCTVLDPFNGAGTTGLVALKNNRNYIGIELNPEYVELTNKRLYGVQTKLF